MKSHLIPKEMVYECDVSETTVCCWGQSGYLPSYKVGGRWWVEPNTELQNNSEINKQICERMKRKGWLIT